MTLRKELIRLVLILIPLVAFITYGLIGLNIRKKKLEKEPSYTHGIIIQKYVGAKARDYVKYEYEVKGQFYQGDQNYMAHKELLRIGDTCEVIYAKSDPDISELIENEDGTIKLRKQNKLNRFKLN